MNSIERYASKWLSREILAIQNSDRNDACIELTIFDKALIYKYTEDGYELVNENLRRSKGKAFSDFGRLLNKALNKLPNFSGLVYRSVHLASLELENYLDAYINNKPLREYAFISTSTSRLTASAYNGNSFFRIYSRTGKEIEQIAKFGKFGTQNEKEVLFSPNKDFKILEIKKEPSYHLITMEEL